MCKKKKIIKKEKKKASIPTRGCHVLEDYPVRPDVRMIDRACAGCRKGLKHGTHLSMNIHVDSSVYSSI